MFSYSVINFTLWRKNIKVYNILKIFNEQGKHANVHHRMYNWLRAKILYSPVRIGYFQLFSGKP